jgi:hypothetical protein
MSMLAGATAPPRIEMDRSDPDGRRPADVGREHVAHVNRLAGADAGTLECCLEDRWVGLGRPHDDGVGSLHSTLPERLRSAISIRDWAAFSLLTPSAAQIACAQGSRPPGTWSPSSARTAA